MAKYIVTLVVETEKHRSAPSKKAVREAIAEDLRDVFIDSPSKAEDRIQGLIRVRSVDLD